MGLKVSNVIAVGKKSPYSYFTYIYIYIAIYYNIFHRFGFSRIFMNNQSEIMGLIFYKSKV